MKDDLNNLLKLGINYVFYDNDGNVKIPLDTEDSDLQDIYFGIDFIKEILKRPSVTIIANNVRRMYELNLIIKFSDNITSPLYKKRKITDVLMEECTFCFLLCMRRIRTTRPVGVPLLSIPLWKIIALMNY